MTERWREVWRRGLAPLLDDGQLEALRRGLAEGDPRLVQGVTCRPPPLACVADWPVEEACATTYPFAFAGTQRTVAEVEEFFAAACFEMDQAAGEAAGCRHFLWWWDDSDRLTAFAALLGEVRAEQQRRAGA